MKALFGLCLMFLAAVALGDDGVLWINGAPKLMSGQSSIRMVEEVVNIKVFEDHSSVVCRFVFKNTGKATTVKMGFPDYRSEGEPGYVHPVMEKFRSSVDGRLVKTRWELNEADEQGFYVKRVKFAAGETHVIVDRYESPHSGGATSSGSAKGGTYVSQVYYAMYSGGSWQGTIGDALVNVDFTPFQKHWQAKFIEEGDHEPFGKFWDKYPSNTVMYSGFGKVTIHGNRISFHAQNLKPTKLDDIDFYFGPVPYGEERTGGSSSPSS